MWAGYRETLDQAAPCGSAHNLTTLSREKTDLRLWGYVKSPLNWSLGSQGYSHKVKGATQARVPGPRAGWGDGEGRGSVDLKEAVSWFNPGH